MSNPLAPVVFLVRNANKSLPLVAVIVLAVMLIAAIVAVINSIPLSIRTTYSYNKFYLAVTPRGNPAMTPVFKHRIETEAPVPLDPLIVCRASECEVKSIVGPWPFAVIALEQADMRRYIQRLGGGKMEGRFPAPGQPEVLVSEPVARNLGKRLGDLLLNPKDPNNYSPKPVKIVGIIRMQSWIALAPVEYYRANHFPPIDALIVMAKDVRQQATLDKWAYATFKGEHARVFTYFELEKDSVDMFKILYSILDVVIGMLVVVITLMMAMLMNIYQSQRTQEFGLLQAIGYTKRALLGRVVVETVLVVLVGWLLGVACGLAAMSVVKATLMDPRAFMLDPWDPQPYLYSVPVPIAIILVSSLTLSRRFAKFDPVGVVERRLV